MSASFAKNVRAFHANEIYESITKSKDGSKSLSSETFAAKLAYARWLVDRGLFDSAGRYVDILSQGLRSDRICDESLQILEHRLDMLTASKHSSSTVDDFWNSVATSTTTAVNGARARAGRRARATRAVTSRGARDAG